MVNIIDFGFRLFDKWLYIMRSGNTLKSFFDDNDYKKIAIYGMGRIGKQLYAELKAVDVDISILIDRNAKCLKDLYNNIITLNELPTFKNIDVIVITPVQFYSEIERQIYEINQDIDVVSVEDVVEYVYRKQVGENG
ncbi:hypothetical protein SAMN02910413_1864 [Pseudobutyrivibrio sp. C4]|uniref:hypothetical protein n=1 Tax=Pseudobutyrivibrio sp. C4 TaxID=1520803 RepID=UPI0008C3573B|nr:hypothetical protein [Pseudobutyrivibrio sp. C4]SET12683.1 hypothetical protein SAMN02910413_1864 [Pseudobutyrivibrio sp. C4]